MNSWFFIVGGSTGNGARGSYTDTDFGACASLPSLLKAP